MHGNRLWGEQNKEADSLKRTSVSTSITTAACLLICYVACKLCTHLNAQALHDIRLTAKIPPFFIDPILSGPNKKSFWDNGKFLINREDLTAHRRREGSLHLLTVLLHVVEGTGYFFLETTANRMWEHNKPLYHSWSTQKKSSNKWVLCSPFLNTLLVTGYLYIKLIMRKEKHWLHG